MAKTKMIGEEQAIANLLKLGAHYAEANRAGVLKAALLLENKARRNTPKDTSNLQASGFTVSIKKKDPDFVWSATNKKGKAVDTAQVESSSRKLVAKARKIVKDADGFAAVVGFGANYSIFVHELHSRKSKFLQRAIRSESDKMAKKIEEELARSTRQAL